MGEKMKKILLIVVALLFCLRLSFVAKSDSDKVLKCNPKGEFAILIVSDPQCDNIYQWQQARDELESLIIRSKPSLVIINGDMNSHNNIPKDMWNIFVSPIEKRNIYWSTTNGNHDPHNHKNYSMYKSYYNCLNDTVETANANYESDRPMNYVLPIFSNDLEDIVFAVYGMDSGQKGVAGYEGVTQKQINWYKEQSDILKSGNNDMPITSILCMHIPLPQILEMYYAADSTIYGAANEINYNTNGYKTKNGTVIDKINIHTSSIDLDNGLFDIILKQGDVKAVLFGHNHRNNFIGSYKGVLLGFVGKLSTGCYSDNLCRGGRVIRFKEDSPQNFTTEWISALDSSDDQLPIYSNGVIAQ